MGTVFCCTSATTTVVGGGAASCFSLLFPVQAAVIASMTRAMESLDEYRMFIGDSYRLALSSSSSIVIGILDSAVKRPTLAKLTVLMLGKFSYLMSLC